MFVDDLFILRNFIKSIKLKKKKKLRAKDIRKEKQKNRSAEGDTSLARIENQTFAISEAFRKEKNFLQFPFFLLHRSRGLNKIELTDTVYDKHGNRAEIFWKVTGSKEYGSPSILEMRISNHVDKIIDNLPKPIENPIRVGSLYSIAKALRREKWKNFKQIKNAFKCIRAATIETKFTFWLKDKEEYYGEPIFSRYDMIYFTGQKMPGGIVADAVYVWLSNPYLQSINANYTVPLDRDYYDSLSSPKTQRLYEFYSIKFYPIFEKNLRKIKINYSELCKYTPLTRQKRYSYIIRQFDSAHKELVKTKFFEKDPEIKPINGELDWSIELYPGERALKWYRRVNFDTQLPLFPEEEDDKNIFNRLIEIGVTKKSAFDLMQKHPLEEIRKQIEFLPYRKAENAPAVLFKSIQEGWSAPTAYIREKKKRDRERKEAELKERQAQAEKEKRDKSEAEEKELEAFYKSLSPEEQAEVDRVAEERLDSFMKKKLREGRAKGNLSPIVKSGLKWSRNNILREKIKEEGRGLDSSKKGKKVSRTS